MFSDFVSLSILISCVFLGICSFHVIFQIHGVRIVNSFIVCEILCITVLFILSWDLCLLWLSVIHLAKRSVIYFSFFRKLTVLIFLSYICFLLKVFCSGFCYFFSPTLGFFSYFLFFDSLTTATSLNTVQDFQPQFHSVRGTWVLESKVL